MQSLFKQKLFIVFNHAVAKARKSQDAIKLVPRIYKAFKILQSKNYYQDEKALYNPTTYSCGCKDWEFHNSRKRGYTGHCCHMIAETLKERINSLTWKQTDFFSKCGG